MIFVGTLDGKIIYTNTAVSEKLGYSDAELKNMYILDVHPDQYKKEAEIILLKMLKKELSVCPIPLNKKNNKLLPVETRVWFGKWDNKAVIYGLSKDLSLVQAEHDKFQKLFESNPCPMVITESGSNKIMQINEAFTEKIGYEKSEIIGKTSYELKLFPDYIHKKELEKQILNNGNIKNVEMKICVKNGDILTGLFSGELLDYMGDEFFLTVMTDITQRKYVEQQLFNAKNEGFSYECVENGKLAVKECLNKKYDIVFMDCQMPIMDGYRASVLIRELSEEYTPIIAMTANAMKGDKKKCIQAGMTDYLSKPIDINRL
jgi:PAS domain S-box